MDINLKKKSFLEYYSEVNSAEKKRIRDSFIKESGLSYPSWYSKLARKNFTPLEMKCLEELCGKSFK